MKKTLTFDVNNPLLIQSIKFSLYGHYLMYHFAVLYNWLHRNQVE